MRLIRDFCSLSGRSFLRFGLGDLVRRFKVSVQLLQAQQALVDRPESRLRGTV